VAHHSLQVVHRILHGRATGGGGLRALTRPTRCARELGDIEVAERDTHLGRDLIPPRRARSTDTPSFLLAIGYDRASIAAFVRGLTLVSVSTSNLLRCRISTFGGSAMENRFCMSWWPQQRSQYCSSTQQSRRVGIRTINNRKQK
jgi:hypothetical protein